MTKKYSQGIDNNRVYLAQQQSNKAYILLRVVYIEINLLFGISNEPSCLRRRRDYALFALFNAEK